MEAWGPFIQLGVGGILLLVLWMIVRGELRTTQEGHFQAIRLARVTIRYREGIKSKMRVAIGSRILEIVSVIDVDERHRQLDLLCEERGV